MSAAEELHAALTGAFNKIAPTGNEDDSGREGPMDHPRAGKVARLPASVRETVNRMLHDNIPYSAIIQKLEALGYPGFIPSNLSRWRSRGFIDWLAPQQQCEEVQGRHDWSRALLNRLSASSTPASLPEIGGDVSAAPDLKLETLPLADSPDLDKALALVVSSQLLGTLSRVGSVELEHRDTRKFLPQLLAAINTHFRERTRFQKLQFVMRQYEEGQRAAGSANTGANSSAKKSAANGANECK